MEGILDRPLKRGESVHHVNGDRGDNRPENLELWVSHQPAGQRPADLVSWAVEILFRYGPESWRPALIHAIGEDAAERYAEVLAKLADL